MGIKPVADLPVGKNLQDHLGVLHDLFARRTPGAFHREMRFDRMAREHDARVFLRHRPGTVVPGGLHAFIKTRPELAVPDIEFMFRGAPASPASVVSAGLARLSRRLRHPPDAAASRQPRRGSAALGRSGGAAAHRLQLLHRAERPAAVARRVSSSRADLAYQQPIDPYRGDEVSPGAHVKTDAEIDALAQKTVITAHHPCGTCAMGIGPDAVLDPELRVRGIEGLRVVDASAMPDLVSAHINACVLMIAEKAADMICGKPPPPPDLEA